MQPHLSLLALLVLFSCCTIVHVHGADSCDGNAVNAININVAEMWANHGKCGEVTCSKSWGAQLSGAVDANTSLGVCRGRAEVGHEIFCEVPNRVVNITFTVVNTGVSSWPAQGMVVRLLTFNETYGNITQAIVTSGPVETGQSLKISVQVRTNANVEGVWPLHFGLFGPCGRFGDDIILRLQSTCSDQYFCNGVERLIQGQCVPALAPACDDHEPCTTDVCDEFWQRCTHRANATDPSCYVCNVDCRADASCDGKECGPDGCIGSCGTCSSGRACVAGRCEQVGTPGTCGNPLPLPNATVIGFHRFVVDTSAGVNNVIPTCNQASAAADLVYVFDVTQAQADAGLYFDGRVSDIRMPLDNEALLEELEPAIIDTVLEVRLGGCGESDGPWVINKNAWCSDDATPPGGYGSRVNIKLSAGRYYVVLDGYSDINVGVVQFEYKFLSYKPVCDGTFCGDDGRGGDCGPCNTTTHTCAANRRCISRTCVPDCAGKACGPDGCGNYCGTCSNGTLCTFSTGTCDVFAVCHHLQPSCGTTSCGANQYCAANCSCVALNAPLPDLVVDVETLMTQMTIETIDFTPNNCGVVEGCISTPGLRRVFRFSVAVINQGTGPLVLPPPPSRPDSFQWSSCHAHFHFKGFARYTLLQSNRVILRGAKEAYCMEDSARSVTFEGPNVPCKPASTCSLPGLQVGWADLYGQDLDCQWIDVTNIKPGLYTLRIELNEERNLLESNYDNNVVDIPVMISTIDGALINMGPPFAKA